MPIYYPPGEARRTISLVEQIDDRVVDKLIADIKRTRSWRCQVTMFINCPGGDVLATKRLCDVLLAGPPADARVAGACHSSALSVLAACRGERSASPTSTFIFHRVESLGGQQAFADRAGRFTSVSAAELLAELRHADRQIVNSLAAGFGVDRVQIDKLMMGRGGAGSRLDAMAMWRAGFLSEVKPRPRMSAAPQPTDRAAVQRRELSRLFPGLPQ